MQLSSQDINALGQITQRGWGTSSMPNSIIATMHNDEIVLKFMTIVHFAADAALKNQVDRITYESIQVLTKCVADMKKKFKDATGKTLKLKETNSTDSVEVISTSNTSPRRIAYYRRQVKLQVV